MKKSSKIEKIQPLSMIVFYHHYKDLTILQVVKSYADGSTSTDVARSTSKIYHVVERRTFFTEVARKIQHVIHNCNYIETININNK